MATVTTERAPQKPSPQPIGHCYYCGQPLYAHEPVSTFDEPLSHVGCAVHARRSEQRQ